MKGLIYTELLDFIEQHAGETGLEEILEESTQSGIYTTVGNYPHQQAVDIIIAASDFLETDPGVLMRLYGLALFQRLSIQYPGFFEGVADSFSLLAGIQTHIHDEVEKLYPDTRPPRFEVVRHESMIEIDYRSHRPFALIAYGMIEGCISYFGEDLGVTTEEPIGPTDTQARFYIRQR